MLSPRLRQDIYALWTMFWSSGMTNPLTSIEQITYLLFLKRLETLDAIRVQNGKRSIYGPRANCELVHNTTTETTYCEGHENCRWSYIMNMVRTPAAFARPQDTHDHLSNYVFPWMRVLGATLKNSGNEDTPANGLEATAERMEEAYFQIPREKTATLTSALQIIDSLFNHLDQYDDLMGDIFEYLLSEIQTSGKNGQFRTPRHIIRFMVNLVDPDKDDLVADPAAGTGGFLLNTIQHVRQKYSTADEVLLEWDGTPHRLDGALLSNEPYPHSENFTGYDLERTMVRIGWMNLLLHGLDDPDMQLQDTLGANFTKSEAYDIIFANPPYTGTIDKSDVNSRFANFITNKTELLFLYLILDLLKTDGRAAVIVPEGVLFGSTNAHKEIRRKLLLDHSLDGVISLPSGIFMPYTGVKTSILVFTKRAQPRKREAPPNTERVWFYEIGKDGYTLDAKRNPEPTPNDLWDALEKWHSKDDGSTAYFQPTFTTVRWRMADEAFYQTFPEAVKHKERIWGNHELFPELDPDPVSAAQQVIDQQQPRILQLFQTCMETFEGNLIAYPRTENATKKLLEDVMRRLDRLFDEAGKELLERGNKLPEYGSKALQPLVKAARQRFDQEKSIEVRVKHILKQSTEHLMGDRSLPRLDVDDVNSRWETEVREIVHEFGKLDGYNVQLRSPETQLMPKPLLASKHWTRAVRIFARTDTWESEDGLLLGSHDETGALRPEFLADPRIYNVDGSVKRKYLDEYCIEANDFSLTASRYRPTNLQSATYDPPEQIIRELQILEGQIQESLATLLALVEGRE